jgi:precorrin-6A synthase
MRKIFVIGIGAGNPDHVTMQAVRALNAVDVFFLLDKREETEALLRLRKDICERYITDPSYRFVQAQDPVRDKGAASYQAGVEAWHQERSLLYETMIRTELAEDACGGFLVWGDPSLYDSTLRIIDQIAARGTLAFEVEVIPGISSVQALAARHRIALNQIGGDIHITTGRRLAAGLPDGDGDLVVMLDGQCAFKTVAADDFDIYWGAYLGTPAEIAVSGRLRDVKDDIERIRAAARAQHGWIMDTYLLRRSRGG